MIEFIWLLNSHPEVTFSWMHGDKDTYRLAFHLANKSSEFAQVRSRHKVLLHSLQAMMLVIIETPQKLVKQTALDLKLRRCHSAQHWNKLVSTSMSRQPLDCADAHAIMWQQMCFIMQKMGYMCPTSCCLMCR